MIGGKKITALCTSRIYDPQEHEFIRLLSEFLRANNNILFIYTLNTDLYWEEDNKNTEAKLFGLMDYSVIDTVIVMDEKIKSRKVAEKIISSANKRGVPVAVVDGSYPDTVSVDFDYGRGFEQIVRHVVEFHKARKLHFIAGIKGNKFSDERIEIFKKVIEENGIAFDKSMMSYGEFWAAPTRTAVNRLIDSGNIPEAVICANDIMALNAADVLKQRGYRVPEDVIVTGFDGIDDVFYSDPRISTVNCSSEPLAEAVGQLIISMQSGKSVSKRQLITPKLQPAHSCGCPDIAPKRNISLLNDKFYRYQDDIRVFQDIEMRMQMCRNTKELNNEIRCAILHDMCCIIDRECFRSDSSYFSTESEKMLSGDLCVLYDSEDDSGVHHLERGSIIPSLYKRINEGYPLIFNLMYFMDKPMGYICYFFKNYDLTDYSKTASISGALSIGLGGFVNMQYQQYLLEKIEDMYKYDPLTGLYNRRGFSAALKKLLGSSANRVFTVIMADLDGLKSINDGYGHESGDTAIAAVAGALKSSCPKGTLCMRYGGDEMIAFIQGTCDVRKITADIDRYLMHFNMEHEELSDISASCGAYTTAISDISAIEDAIRIADEEMYKVKKKHRRKR